MKQSYFRKLLIVICMASSLVACNKSSFKIRDGKSGGVAPTGQPTTPTPGTPSQPGNPGNPSNPGPNNPGQPPSNLPTTMNPDRHCQYQHEILASFTFRVYGGNNLELFWNPFHGSMNNGHVSLGSAVRPAFYKVIIKDKSSGVMFVSRDIPEKPVGDPNFHSFYVDNQVLYQQGQFFDSHGQPTQHTFELAPGVTYWYDIVAYDSNGNTILTPRGYDIVTDYPRQHIEAGFCSDYQYKFPPGIHYGTY